MTQITDQTIHEVVEAVVRRLAPDRVILFGSRAEGSARADSDIDLLVVMNDPPLLADAWAIAYELAPRLPLELHFITPRQFERTKDVVGGLAYPAHQRGRVLYAAQG